MATDDDYLLLSGIQHFAFCARQWALIHIEGIWAENYLTAQGRLLHERADDPWFNEIRGGKIIARAMPIRSEKLKLQGVADIVELIEDSEDGGGVSVPGHEGRWLLRPVKYKRGKPKAENCDAVQLCAQAMCLEEMTGAHVQSGEIFYGQIRRRTEVAFDDGLRGEVKQMSEEMQRAFLSNEIPVMKREARCKACSLVNECNPGWGAMRHDVDRYIAKEIGDPCENF